MPSSKGNCATCNSNHGQFLAMGFYCFDCRDAGRPAITSALRFTHTRTRHAEQEG